MFRSPLSKIAGLFLLGLFALLLGRQMAAPDASAPPVQPAALAQLTQTVFPDMSGQSHRLQDWTGKVLVVNFWATWCPPCRAEMPAFSRLQQQHGAEGVQFVGIAMDSAENVQQFAAQHPVSYPLLLGSNSLGRLMHDLGNPKMGLPFTLIIAADGRVIASRTGAVSENQMLNLIRMAQGKP